MVCKHITVCFACNLPVSCIEISIPKMISTSFPSINNNNNQREYIGICCY